MNRIILFVFLFFVLRLFSFAQSTGYMGKRLLLGYGFHTSPTITGSNAKNESIIGSGGNAETGALAFNVIHEGYLEFAVSSKWMICFSARFYKTTYDNRLNFKNYEGNYNNESYIQYRNSSPDGFYNMRGLTYTLYFKYYGARYVAPWGRYVMFGPTLNTVKTSYDPAIMKVPGTYYNSNLYGNNASDTIVSYFGPTEQTFKGLNLMLGFGRSRIIANRVTIDYGCNIHLFSLANTLFDFNGTGFFHRQETIDANNYIERSVLTRVRGVNRINVFLKVGILLF
jgi:hypothetical protein